MGYRNLQECLFELKKTGQLVEIDHEVDPYLEAAEIHRRVCAAQGPALLFRKVKGTPFPMVSNLFGTLKRTRWIFRDTLKTIEALMQAKVDPGDLLRHPFKALKLIPGGWHTLPSFRRDGPILRHQTSIQELPQLVSWPKDGGAFITLPAVYSEDVDRPGIRGSNLGMYRVQLSGNDYQSDEIGLHYQIHRGIGVHQTKTLEKNQALPVHIFVGGPPSLSVSAVMPLPEGLPELFFAGVLAGRRLSFVRDPDGLPIPAEADFCLVGTIEKDVKPEGPFGDHLGYYSLIHDQPVMKVKRVWHRPGAIWPFTVVGRPPQEDTSFGQFIHEVTGPVIPTVVPGVEEVHAVDATGVHPLMLAKGSERYTPYLERKAPMELLTQANGILGQGQMSLAKYLMIVARQDNPDLNINNIPHFFKHLLERVDWSRDLHFQTKTTIDTLDYSGTGWNQGSKVVIAAVGPAQRELPKELPGNLKLPEGFKDPGIALPGILTIQAPSCSSSNDENLSRFCQQFALNDPINSFPLIILCDDSAFTAKSLNNFLWVTFTRSNPSHDIDGIQSFQEHKHWGCRGSLVIDARIKPHHAPPLVKDPQITKKVDALGISGKPLHGII